MAIYTVHAPPQTDEAASNPERFAFVRDGFHFWAFVFGPVWLLFKRLWLAIVIYIAIIIVLQAFAWLLGVPRPVHSVISFLMHLLIGLEAGTIRRWTLSLRGWVELAVVNGDGLETAERRFFATWVEHADHPTAPPPPPPMPPSMRMPPAPSDIVGLFPEPQSRQ